MAEAGSGGTPQSGSTRPGPAAGVFVLAMLCLMGVITFAAYNISHTLGWVTAALLVAYVIYSGWRDGSGQSQRMRPRPTDEPHEPAGPPVPDTTRAPVA